MRRVLALTLVLGAARAAVAQTAPPEPARRLKTPIDLSMALSSEQSELALEDWPEVPLTDVDREALQRARLHHRAGAAARVLEELEPLVARRPASAEARWLRAQALEALGRYDHARRELQVLLQLRPSHARAWRQLAILLATHGGAMDADRADEALRRALALEPAWDDLRGLRARVAEKRAPRSERSTVSVPPPTLEAQDKLRQAQQWLAELKPDLARQLLVEALAASPGYVEAAAGLFALTGQVPAPTVEALWQDPANLLRLAIEIQSLGPQENALALVRPWIDQAVALGAAEALFARAVLRAQTGDPVGALADLTGYVASEPNPPHLDQARVLRASLAASPGIAPSPERRAQVALANDRPDEAEQALGAPCRAGLAPARLVAIGRVHEYESARGAALACYRLALESLGVKGESIAVPQAARPALERLALVAAGGPLELAAPAEPLLRTAHRASIPAAAWALARLAEARQEAARALSLTDEFLRQAPDEPLASAAREARDRLAAASRATSEARRRQQVFALSGAGVALLALLVLVAGWRLRGATVARALARRPALFPELARAVAEIRHDVLKHRASALGLLSCPPPENPHPVRASASASASASDHDTRREEVARALLEPTPVSRAVRDIYQRLSRTAAGLGAPLRPIRRDPVFGPLHGALARAEVLVEAPDAGEALAAVEVALRERHEPQLARLLALGPRTTLDAGRLSRWIGAVESELAAGFAASGAGWVSPGLLLEEINLTVPVEDWALATIFKNFLRNAVAAVQGQEEPHLLVRVEGETDVTGRRMVKLVVADSAPGGPTLDEIEARDGQRGLGIVRDLARQWGGHLLVRPEVPPLEKGLGVSFPAAPPPSPPEPRR